ncbi:MAG: hypothetical protein IPM79_33530 [Polyangiaceae bacterium]|jgi:hypothetical protein|nr:hypothetical protein [Polyangiaceae bacterium]MBK8942391.1 hypothetical protein [Polyangiaceae bacterium]
MAAEDSKPNDEEDAPKETSLAELARLARERMGPEPDFATPAALSTLAAVVRDLKGMPQLTVSREHKHRLRLGRRGKVGSLGLEYHPKIHALELGFLNWPGLDPTSMKVYRYTFDKEKGAAGEWHRMDDGGEFIEDVRDALSKLYPELGQL